MSARVAAALALLAWPASAAADAEIVATPSNRFATPSVSIDQGGRVTFSNQDVNSHDVTSELAGSDSKPLFSSRIIGPAERAGVAGTEYLSAGSYAFICSLHPFMRGTLAVTTSGSPVPRPGGGGGAGGGPGTDADATPPRLRLVLLRGGRLRVTSSEPSSVRLTIKIGRRASERTIRVESSRSVSLGSPRGKRARVSVRAAGRDAAGNVGKAAISGKTKL